MPKRDDAQRFLPIKPAPFHILLALADGPRHGYAIRTEVEERTGGEVRLWPATLYGTVRQLTETGLIEPLEGEVDEGDDPRRRYYRLTGLGERVLRAEIERMHALVNFARRTKALGRT